MTEESGWGREHWRGCVVPWQCDEMGHQSARFYITQAMEGLAGFFVEEGIGFPDSPTPTVLEHHVRFHRELRPGTPVHLQCAVVGLDEDHITVAQLLLNSATNEVVAAYQVRCSASGGWAVAATARPPSWSIPAALPDSCRERGLAPARPHRPPTLEEADRLQLVTAGRGTIRPDECDRAGHFLVDRFMARFSDATRLFMTHFHDAVARSSDEIVPIGSAGVESRVTYYRRPVDGDRFVIRCGLAAFGEKTRLVEYWMLDAASGAAWARLESLELLIDLDTRRTFSLPAVAQEHLKPLLRDFPPRDHSAACTP